MRPLTIDKRITNRDNASISRYFSDINKIPLLTTDEEGELANKVAAGDEQALDILVKSNLRFVVSVAKQYQNRGLDLSDLIDEGNIGLIKAARKFDNSRGFKFISYAVWWIRQSMIQAISEQAKLIRVPNNQTTSLTKLYKATSNLEQHLEREPTDDEIQELLNVFDLKVRDLKLVSTKTVSLESPISSSEDSNSLLDLIINNNSVSPDEELHKESMHSDIVTVLNRLSERQKSILCMYYGLFGQKPLTLEEIGEQFKLTRERVRQIKDGALKILKGRVNSSVLIKHFDF